MSEMYHVTISYLNDEGIPVKLSYELSQEYVSKLITAADSIAEEQENEDV